MHCKVATHGKRLIDQLNEAESDYLDAEDARIFQRQEGEPMVVPGSLLISKPQVHMAMPTERKPGSNKLFFATIDRRRFQVVVTLPTALIEGSIQAKIAKEPRSFLTVDAGPFFAVTSAIVHHCAVAQKLETPVVIVRKALVSSLVFLS